MKNQTVRVTVTYSWTFTQKQWLEHQDFFSMRQDLINKITFDNVDMFHHLNQMVWPDTKEIKVEAVNDTQL